MYGKIVNSRLIRLSCRCKIDGAWHDSDSDDPVVAAWRTANGWLPVVEDDANCTASEIPCYGGYVEQNGAIHHVCTAKAITAATVAEIRAAAKAGKINPSKLSATVKADMLVKLLEN